MNMNLITDFLTDLDYTYGFIALIVSIILVAVIKIMETVRHMKDSVLLPKDTSLNHSVFIQDKEIDKEREFIDNYLASQPEDSTRDTNDGFIELSNIPEDSSVFVQNPEIVSQVDDHEMESPMETTIEIKDAIPSEIHDYSEIEDFKLFSNPEYIFTGALQEIFNKKLKIVLNQIPVYRLVKFPFFKISNGSLQRFYVDTKPEIIIEELFELWRMGYTHPELPVLFIHYLFSIKSEIASRVLKSILKQNLLNQSESHEIRFLYQDILDIEVQLPAFTYPGTEASSLSTSIHNGLLFLNRSLWKHWEDEFFQYVHEDRKGEFFLFFYEVLKDKTSFLLNYILLNKFRHILSSEWREYIDKQAFYYGHYEKLNRLSFVPPEYNCLISKGPANSRHLMHDLLALIKSKYYHDLHSFLILYMNKSRDINTFQIEDDKLNSYLENLRIPFGSRDYIPQAIRFILYLYFYKKNDMDKVNFITPYIHGKIGKFIPKLYQIRIIFRNKDYERAWEEINKIWDQDESNMLLMNEAAVYAYHSGRIKEAELLFNKLRNIYPDNPQILHNEAVFLQHKARIVNEKKKTAEAYLNSRFAG